MDGSPVIAIVGATGVVGSEMLSIIGERKIEFETVKLLASKNSVGELYNCNGQEFEVEELTEESFAGVHFALFATDKTLSEQYVPAAIKAGAVAIDNSSFYRMDRDVPLIVPEVNGDKVTSQNKIIANPNCSTAQLVPVLDIILKEAGLKRVVVSTYQAVSGAGKAALDELWEQTRAIFTQKHNSSEVFAHPIAFNCIPQIDTILDSGYTKEEQKVIEESRKILGLPDLAITCTAVRVPVFHSHAESVNVETERSLDPVRLVELLEAAPGVTVYANHSEFPMQVDTTSQDDIFVGRIRRDDSVEHGLNLWIVADNLRKGAALNAVQILELLQEKIQ